MPIKPKGIVTRSNDPKEGFAKIGEPQVQIVAWCPDKYAKVPPTQVHFIMHWPVELSDLPPLVIRFKGPDTLGFFIEELMKYRRTVWPNCEKVTGEQSPASLEMELPEVCNCGKPYPHSGYCPFCGTHRREGAG